MEVVIYQASSGRELSSISNFNPSSTIQDVKRAYHKIKPSLYPERQALRLNSSGKILKDEETLGALGFHTKAELYLKDLGPQVGWATVFMVEYTGPLFVYLAFYARPDIIYGAREALHTRCFAVHVAAMCWSFHYAKRVLETLFVHRFSHATMPLANIFKNCSYYWGFAAIIGYFMNHPLYTPPMFGPLQLAFGVATFMFGEVGNLSIHLALANLRPPGTKIRRIPEATLNPFTLLFHFVSCPNYSYEIISWGGFTILSQCLPALVFTLVGFGQMSVWARGKHENYKKEFKSYPTLRTAIIPFIL